MEKNITVTLSEEAISRIGQFVTRGIDSTEEQIAESSEQDGYTQEDIQSSVNEIREAQGIMSRLLQAISDADLVEPAGQKASGHEGTDRSDKINLASIQDGWALYSPNEASTMDGRGFWNIESLWSDEEDVTTFPAESVGNYALPQSLGQDRHWINLALVKVTTEAGLCDALAVFCDSYGLPHLSADEVLFAGEFQPFQGVWLRQFINQWDRAMEA